jgi:tRNA dimethylallyltransferase
MTKLIVICGATATGKSGLALELAMRLNTVILSADSRQVYREFDIGTAKPTKAEQALVPHYLIDICNPTEIMTVADFQQQVYRVIEGVGSRESVVGGIREVRKVEGVEENKNKNTSYSSSTSSTPYSLLPTLFLLAGGTGLYIKSIVRGMKIPRVAPNIELRSHLELLGQVQLYEMLQQVDSVAASKIHANDSVRTLRALEVYYVTGIPISEQQGENPPDYPILQIGLDCEPMHLQERIAQRTKKMVKDGFVEEVKYLCGKYGEDLPLLNTLGYQEIKQYLAGEISLDEAKELIVIHTRQFAKRQRTWFRAVPDIEWFDVESSDLLEKVWQRIQLFN